MTVSPATVLPIALGSLFVGAGLVVLIYAVARAIRPPRYDDTPPPPVLVARREPAPTAVIPCITSAAWPRGRSADDTLVTHRVLPEDVTAVLPRARGGRRAAR